MNLTTSAGNVREIRPGAATGDWLDGEDTARRQRYRELLDFYQGAQWPTRKRPAETRLTINYARALVRKVASYVFPEPVVFNVVPAGDQGETARRAEAALNELQDTLDLHALDFQTLIDAAVLGDGAFKVTWDEVAGSPLVTAVDPAQLWAWSAPDNVRRITRVAQRYTVHPLDGRRLFGIAEWNGQSRVVITEEWTADRVTISAGDEVVRDEANPYGWIPYVIFANNGRPHELWGESDLVDLIDLCRELNQRMTVLSRILQVSGNPIVVLENVNGADGIRADPGQVWELPEDSRAYLLDMLSGGGVRLHIDYIEALYRALYDLAETPRSSFGDSGRNLSGAALEIEIQPLVQKVQRKRRVWDSVYRRRNAMLLDLLERFGGEDFNGTRRSDAIWGSILPAERAELARSEASLVAAGIHSRRTAIGLLGDEDPEAEWQRIRSELDELREAELPRA